MWASPDASTIWLSSRYQIWKFNQAPAQVVPYQPPNPENDDSAIPAWTERGYDVTYLPRVGHTTGHLDVHDMAIDSDGRLIFMNTMFGCAATQAGRTIFPVLTKHTSNIIKEVLRSRRITI